MVGGKLAGGDAAGNGEVMVQEKQTVEEVSQALRKFMEVRMFGCKFVAT
jgi:hypothetical protein